MTRMKKHVALFLAFVMCLSMVNVPVFAVEDEHEHNANGWSCTYTEPVIACTHAHDENCGYAEAVEGLPCAHIHDGACGYVEAVEGAPCTCGAEPDEDGNVTHEEGCGYAGAVEGSPCSHEHGAACGYVAAAEGADCIHECGAECIVSEGYWTCTAPEAGEETPDEVKAFLDAVAALPAASEVTAENAQAIGAQVNAALDLYEAIENETEEVTEALNTVYAVFEAVLAAEEVGGSDTFDVERTDNVLKSPYQNFAPNTPNGSDLPVRTNGQVQDLMGTVQLNGADDSATDYLQARYYTNHGGAYATGFTMITVSSSNSGVATAKAVQDTVNGKPCIRVDFTPGTKKGTTTIEVGYTVVNLDNEHGIGIGNDFYMYVWGYVYYTVTNNGSGSGTVDPGKPEKPTVSDVPSANQDGYVYIKCVTYPNSNPHYKNTRIHAGFMRLRDSTEGWSFGEVYANDGRFGSDISAEDYPWFCDLTLDKDWYLYQWNKNYSSQEDTHYLADKKSDGTDCSGPVSMTFLSDGEDWYYFTEDVPLVVWTTHKAPVIPTPTYTVTYTDGVEDEIVFPDQSTEDLKEGETTPEFEGTPTREGYTFEGWAPAVKDTVDPTMADKNGVIVYTATWDKLEDPVVTKSVDNSEPVVGEEFTYTIKVENGNSTPVTVTVTDVLNGKLDFVSASDGGTCVEDDEGTRTVTWNDVAVGANGSKELTLTVKANAAGVIDNEAKVGNVPSNKITVTAQEPESIERTFKLVYHEKLGSDTDETAVTNMPAQAPTEDPKNPVVSTNVSETLTISNTVPVREGYTFVAWQWGGAGEQYQPGDEITLTANPET